MKKSPSLLIFATILATIYRHHFFLDDAPHLLGFPRGAATEETVVTERSGKFSYPSRSLEMPLVRGCQTVLRKMLVRDRHGRSHARADG